MTDPGAEAFRSRRRRVKAGENGIDDETGAIHIDDQFDDVAFQRWYPPRKESDKLSPTNNDSLNYSGAMSGVVFPFNIADLRYWVIKRKDGTIIRSNLRRTDPTSEAKAAANNASTNNYFSSAPASYGMGEKTSGFVGVGKWCQHDPTALPVYTSPDGKVNLFIADCEGARKHYHDHNLDLLIDGGQVFKGSGFLTQSVFDGDYNLKGLEKYAQGYREVPDLLTIDWADRKAPPIDPAFWRHLAKQVKGNVMTVCQGGHGRSGTALVCLMMALNPEYDAQAAILHLRAIHCARAIESHEQHGYIDLVAKNLGREGNSSLVHGVKSYADAFKALKLNSAKPYQERLNGKSGNK